MQEIVASTWDKSAQSPLSVMLIGHIDLIKGVFVV